MDLTENVINVSVLLKNIYLSKGIYNITFSASEDISTNINYKIHKAITFRIDHEMQIWTPFLLDAAIIKTQVLK